jgi:hypothetical protein
MTGAAPFFIKNGSSSGCISRLIKKFKKVEVGRDFGEFLSGQIGFDHPRPLHSNIHGGDMIPEFGCQIQLGISEVHSAKIRSNLPSVSLESVTSDTAFIQKEAASFGWIFGKGLGDERRNDEKENDPSDHHGFLGHMDLR